MKQEANSSGNELTEFLDQCTREILLHGPDRVMISDNESTSSKRARTDYSIFPDIIFIRNDGWALGAPTNLANYARLMWESDWVGVLLRPSIVPIPYKEWLENTKS